MNYLCIFLRLEIVLPSLKKVCRKFPSIPSKMYCCYQNLLIFKFLKKSLKNFFELIKKGLKRV